ncbi:unnamed protein product, partial [Closterium sp. Naga37s-1]
MVPIRVAKALVEVVKVVVMALVVAVVVWVEPGVVRLAAARVGVARGQKAKGRREVRYFRSFMHRGGPSSGAASRAAPNAPAPHPLRPSPSPLLPDSLSHSYAVLSPSTPLSPSPHGACIGAAAAVVLRAGQHPMRPHLIPSFTWHVLRGLRRHGFEAYLVGGSIRDLLLDVPPKDYDVLSTATTHQIRKSFPRARIVGRRFPICHVMVGGEIVEVSSFKTKEQLPQRRKRVARTELRMPATKLAWLDDDTGDGEERDDEVEEEGDDGEEEGEEEEEVEEEGEGGEKEGLLVPVRPPREMVERKEWTGKDSERWLNAARRDFTVNGCVCSGVMLMLDPFSGTLYDYVGALHDIKTRVLRTIQPALPSFLDDPVRVLRAMRMAAKARLSLHEDIVSALESPRLLSSLAHVNKERVQQEVTLLLSYGSSETAVRLLWSHRLMPLLLPLHSARLLDRGFPTSPSAAATADDLLFAMLRQLDRLTAPNAPCRPLV